MTHSIQDAEAERWSLALRPARSSDGDALQTYVRGLSPQSRYNRFWASQANSRRRNWRAHWPLMVVTLRACS